MKEPPLKILLVANMYPSDEKPYAGIFIKNQYEYLQQLKAEQDKIDIIYMRRTFTNLWGSLKKYAVFVLRFIRYMFRSYDIIHLHYFYPLYVLVYFYKITHPSTKVIVTFHGGDITDRFHRKYLQNLFRFLARKIDYTIAVGQILNSTIKRKLDLNVNKNLCAGVNENVFFYDRTIDKKYDILFTGSFYYNKGIDILIRAIKKLDNQEAHYCFVGSGPYGKEIHQLTQNYNCTIFTNKPQSELRKIYNQSKFLVLPSRKEAFGLVVSEAMFCGTPAVVSNLLAFQTQVKDKQNGFIVDHNTSDKWCSVLKKCLTVSDQEYKQLQTNSLKSNKENSLSHVCHKLLDIYRNLMKQ